MPQMKQIGTHDTGFWDLENKVRAQVEPQHKGLSINEALALAQDTPGAELLVVREDGLANVHSLRGDSFKRENKQILLSQLDRNPARRQDLDKTPFAIDDRIAQAFGGQGAFLVDEQNKSSYLGSDVDQATAQSKLADARQFVPRPTASRIQAAYAIANDAGQPSAITQELGGQILSLLDADFHRGQQASTQIAYLTPGQTQNSLNALVSSLNALAGQESERTGELQSQLQARTEKWEGENASATQNRDRALSAWRNAKGSEDAKVSSAARNLREARMPGVHQLEQDVQQAQSKTSQAQTQYNSARSRYDAARSTLQSIEALPASAESDLRQARALEDNNETLMRQALAYTATRLTLVRSELSDVQREYRRTESDLESERRKPTRPSGGNTSGDPFGKDPFAGDDSGDDPFGKDPFAGGGSSSDPFGKDPFAGGDYRDDSKIRSLESRLRSLRSERDDLEDQESALENISTQLTWGGLERVSSFNMMDLEWSDRSRIKGYKDQKESNDSKISRFERSARSKNDRYRRELSGAQRDLRNAESQGHSAREALESAQSTQSQLEGRLSQLKANPRPDSHAAVKPAATAHRNALAHREATVGAEAPLTQSKNQTQAALDKIDGDFRRDKQALEGQIRDVRGSLKQEARTEIAQTRRQLGL